MNESGQNVEGLPVLWHLQVSHYVEKVRWALDYKRVPHIRRSWLPGVHIREAKRLTGDTSTSPVLTIDGRSIGDSTRIIAAIEVGRSQTSTVDTADAPPRSRLIRQRGSARTEL